MKVLKLKDSFSIDGTGEFIKWANDFLSMNKMRAHSPYTVKSYAYDLVKFGRWLQKRNITWNSAFTQKTLQEYLITCQIVKLKPRSINRKLACIRVFYRFCFGQFIPHASGVLYPKAHFRRRRDVRIGLFFPRRNHVCELKVKVPAQLIDPLKPIEVDAFLTDIKRYRDLSIVLVMLLCGLRSSEAIGLTFANVDFHQNQLKVLGKGNKERFIPLPFKLMQVFEKYMQIERPKNCSEKFFVILQGKKTGEPMTTEGIRSLFRYRRMIKKIPRAKPHQFRHAFASDLARAGMPLTTIQKLLGHSDPSTTEVYVRLFIEDIRVEYERAMKRIEVRYASLKN
jgi:integrase/recombinase XerC